MNNFQILINGLPEDIGEYIVEKAQKRMDKRSFGRVYVIKGKIHIASKIGAPPNNLSGDLRSTFRYKSYPTKVKITSGDESKGIDYSRSLEEYFERYNLANIKKVFRKDIDKIIHKKYKENVDAYFKSYFKK